MVPPENYNTLIMQECTDLPMITQHINNTFILNIKIHIYIHNNSTNTHKTHKHIRNIFYLLAIIAVINFIKKKENK